MQIDDITQRDEWLALEDEALLASCRIDTCRGSGPGGQKRNKTSSMVRLVHLPSGVVSENDETRSQHRNRGIALHNLRMKLALSIRQEMGKVPVGPPPGHKTNGYILWLARILDALEAVEYKLPEATVLAGIGSGRIVKELARTPAAWQLVNTRRVALGLHPLKQ